MGRVLVIPAAGPGSRLGLPVPKVLAPVAGRAMLDHLLDLYAQRVDRVVLVLQPSFEAAVRAHGAGRRPRLEIALQAAPTGMLDAILAPLERLRELDATCIWVTWCDQIAVQPRTVARLAELCEADPDACLWLPTVERRHPYVHFARDARDEIASVLERREGDAMPEVGESDCGLFGLSRRGYFELLPEFARGAPAGARTGERNFLGFVPWLRGRAPVRTFRGCDPIESLGINTPADLAAVEAHLRRP